MKTKKLSILLLSVVSAFSFTLGSISVYRTVKAQETAVDNIIESFESEYAVGETINVPDAYFMDGNNQVKANKTIIYPDGSQFRINEFTPTVMGKYTVQYSAVTSSGFKKETKEFYVYTELYNVEKKTDKISYGTNWLTPNTQGLNIGLEDESTFYYNEVIDLNALGSKPFVSFYVTPEKVKEADGLDLVFTLTDAYDETNYVDIWVRSTREYSTWQHGASYISAGAAFQTRAGLEWGSRLHQDNLWGFGQDFSFFGCNTKGEVDEATLTSKKKTNGQLQLFFDLETKILKTQGSSSGFSEVIDLDNPEYFTDLWYGFTTGEVYLSITAKAVSKSHLNFVLTEVGGKDLSVNKTVDNGAPYISVDTLDYEELPQAVVNHPYPIFEGKAKDAYCGELPMNVAVYMNYGSPSQSNVNIVDGSFIPTMAGNYYIVYSAKDYSGNYGEKVVHITCVSDGNEIVLDVETEGRVTAANLGEYVKLPAYTVSGGNGEVDVQITVTDASGAAVEILNNEFKVVNQGNYTVTYTATDFVGVQKVYSYTLTTSLSNKPVFDKDPIFPKYIISGYEYVLPELKAYDYANGEKEVAVTIKITDDDGERTLGTDRKATFKVATVGEIKTYTITYEATSQTGVSSKTYDVKVVNAKKVVNGAQRLDVSKYFYSENVNAVGDTVDIKLNTAQDGSVEFINPLVASGLTVNFIMSNTSSLGGLKFTLEDSVDTTTKIEILLSNGETGKTNYTVNEGTITYVVSVPYTSGEFNLAYNDTRKAITLDGNNFITLKTNLNGSKFNGFESGKVRLYIDFVGVKGETSIAVKTINSQILTANTVLDRVSPWIVTQSMGSRVKKIGETVTIYPAIVGDVLDPSLDLSVKVMGDNNKIVETIDGIALNNVSGDKAYQFKLNDYGTYRIIYTAIDDAGNETAYPVLIRVIDTESPVVTLARENISTAKKGSTFVVAPITVSDNDTPAENVTVCCFITRPNGMRFTMDLATSNSFVANETGVYTIRYMAVDSMGNITIVENNVTVTE